MTDRNVYHVNMTMMLFHRTVKLCDQLKTGVFKLHIEAGGKTQTKAISLCVAGEIYCV